MAEIEVAVVDLAVDAVASVAVDAVASVEIEAVLAAVEASAAAVSVEAIEVASEEEEAASEVVCPTKSRQPTKDISYLLKTNQSGSEKLLINNLFSLEMYVYF